MAVDTIRINLTKDYETNGVVVPAGSHELPKDLADDLIRREKAYQDYKTGITEKREYIGKAGNISMGDA